MSFLSPTTQTTTAPKPGRYSWTEVLAVVAILGAFIILGINAINNRAYIGQDFGFHYESTEKILRNSDRWFFMDFTSRPLIYWVGAAGFLLTNDNDGIRTAALLSLGSATLGLFIAFDSIRGAITRLQLRLAALAFVTFIPVTVITAVVYAADTAAILPFALVCWSSARLLESDNPRSRRFAGVVLVFALSISQFAKFTFIAVPIAVTAAFLLAGRFKMTGWRVIVTGCLYALLIPLAIGGWLHQRAQIQLAGQPARHTYDWRGTGEMTWRSLLWPKSTDRRIFTAPAYWDTAVVDGKEILPLIERNSYTYPALLHLGVFTDVLGVTYRNSVAKAAPQFPEKRKASVIAVRSGLLFSVPIALSVFLFIFLSLQSILKRQCEFTAATWIWGSLALAWFLPIFLTLPYVKFVYDWGYWLPRLILPAIWGFSVIYFSMLDRLAKNAPVLRWLPWTVCGLTFVQSSLHFWVLWT